MASSPAAKSIFGVLCGIQPTSFHALVHKLSTGKIRTKKFLAGWPDMTVKTYIYLYIKDLMISTILQSFVDNLPARA